jgi:ferritin-like metal-binding protein YciE
VKLNNLDDLLIEELQDLYSAENQLVKALPKMAKAASNDSLRRAFEEHLEQTKGHVNRLEQVFEDLGQKAKSKKCQAMEGLIEEAGEFLSESAEPSVRDAGMITCAQKVEHYEIAGYSSVRTWAQQLGHQQAARLLQQTLDEEGAADKKLTQIAERMSNPQAAVGAVMWVRFPLPGSREVGRVCHAFAAPARPVRTAGQVGPRKHATQRVTRWHFQAPAPASGAPAGTPAWRCAPARRPGAATAARG